MTTVPTQSAFARARRAASDLRSRFEARGAEMFSLAMQDNIAQLADRLAGETRTLDPLEVLDLGCWNGETTAKYLPARAQVTGVESSPKAAEEARERGWTVVEADLNGPLPLDDDGFDAVTSNQVIEHLHDTDSFMSEAFRVLRPGGVALISTENMASWHNIGALVLGWQAFSLTNVTKRSAGLGNPLANLRLLDEPIEDGWLHQRIFAYRGLYELAATFGFEEVTILGSGYYPLPTRVAHADPRHAAFLTVVGRKPLGGRP